MEAFDESILIPCLIIATVALLIATYIIVQVLGDYSFYAKSSGFTHPTLFFIGTFTAFYLVALAGYEAKLEGCKKSSYLSLALFYLFYVLFTLNLALRTEYYVKGARTPTTTGAFYMFLGISVLLYSLALNRSAALIPPILWCVYLIYNWMVN